MQTLPIENDCSNPNFVPEVSLSSPGAISVVVLLDSDKFLFDEVMRVSQEGQNIFCAEYGAPYLDGIKERSASVVIGRVLSIDLERICAEVKVMSSFTGIQTFPGTTEKEREISGFNIDVTPAGPLLDQMLSEYTKTGNLNFKPRYIEANGVRKIITFDYIP